jgi:hypothetical protein
MRSGMRFHESRSLPRLVLSTSSCRRDKARQGTLAHLVIAAVPFLAIVLAGCDVLRLPGMTSVPTASAVLPMHTPTLAPALLTPIPTYTQSPTALPSAATPTPTFGLPPPPPTCSSTPQWGLGEVWKNESVRTRLGCTVDEQMGVQGEEVYLERGHMLWRPDAGLIYVLFEADKPGGWGAFTDTFVPTDADSDPQIVAPTPQAGGQVYTQPTGRFGKLWRGSPLLRERLGWAMSPSTQRNASPVLRFTGAVQDFDGGTLFWNGTTCFVLRTDDMSWIMY